MSVSSQNPVTTWRSGYAIGVPQIDDEHRRLFGLADQMHVAMLEGKGKEVLCDLLDQLVRYTEYHFDHEEQLMQRIGYPECSDHARQHQSLRDAVHDKRARAGSGETTMTIELMQFLVEWMRCHTTASDRRIAAFLAGRPA